MLVCKIYSEIPKNSTNLYEDFIYLVLISLEPSKVMVFSLFRMNDNRYKFNHSLFWILYCSSFFFFFSKIMESLRCASNKEVHSFPTSGLQLRHWMCKNEISYSYRVVDSPMKTWEWSLFLVIGLSPLALPVILTFSALFFEHNWSLHLCRN